MQVDLNDYDGLCRAAVAALAERADAVRIPDPDARWQAGGAHSARSAVSALAMAVLDRDSPRRMEPALCRRLEQALGALKRLQHDDGLIDLATSNFHSPPDTAFMVEDLTALVGVVRDGCEPSPVRDRLLGELEGVIVRACDGIARGGVHTPNHRWKAASALTLADALFPHEAWRREARAYLDEGIDIDGDGEFTERSTGSYNCVCDLALILLGRALGRREYLEYADRNLRHVLHLLHADGTLVTSYSRRQDRDRPVGIEQYLLLYWYRGLMRGDGLFWSAAQLALRRMLESSPGRLGGLAVWLRFFREAGERTPPEPVPLPADYESRFEGVGVLRRRSGPLSLTIMSGSADLLAACFGAGPEIGLRIATGLAPRGQFIAGSIEGACGQYALRSHHACEYFGPGPDPLPAVDWRSRASFSRRVFVSTELTVTLAVEAHAGGLRLRLRSDGCPRVPVEVAFRVRRAEKVEPAGTVTFNADTGKQFLDAGDLIVRGPTHALRIGPGSAEHDLTDIPTGQPYPTAGAYCVRLVTPLEASINIVAEDGDRT